MLAEFDEKLVEEGVKRNSPWTFDKHLSKIRFTKASFWIRLYDLPLKGMNAKVGRIT